MNNSLYFSKTFEKSQTNIITNQKQFRMRKLFFLVTAFLLAALSANAAEKVVTISAQTDLCQSDNYSGQWLPNEARVVEEVTVEPVFNGSVEYFSMASGRLTIPGDCGIRFSVPAGMKITQVKFPSSSARSSVAGATPSATDDGVNLIWANDSESITIMMPASGKLMFLKAEVSVEGEVAPVPTITLDPAGPLSLGEAPIVHSIAVKGENLEGDITLTCPEYVTADKTTITKAEAESETGCFVTFTVNPPASIDMARYEVVFASENAQSVTLVLSGKVVVVPTVSKLEDIKGGSNFKFDGEVLVTYVDAQSKSFFVEADGQAWRVYTDQSTKFDISKIAAGDIITKFRAETYDNIAQRNMYLQDNKGGNLNGVTRVSEGNEVKPTVITLADLDEKYAETYNMLVKLENITVPEAEGKTIAATSAMGTNVNGLTVKQGETTLEKVLGTFADSEVVGEAAPEGAFNLVGIRLWTSGVLARTKADITDYVVPPTISLDETEVKLSATEGEQATKAVKLTMANCTAPVVITAKETANEITLSTMSIEPTEEPVEIIVTFAPTKEGVVKQQFEFTTEGLEEAVVLEVEGTGLSFIEMVAAEADGMYRVYNTAGVLVMETADAAALQSLTPGLYIVNGRKYMLR